MMTGAEWKAAGMVETKTGWAVMRAGRRIDDHLYEEEWAARWTANCFEGAYIAKARRVRSISMKKPMWIIEE
jgi:hypothetical protein